MTPGSTVSARYWRKTSDENSGDAPSRAGRIRT